MRCRCTRAEPIRPPDPARLRAGLKPPSIIERSIRDGKDIAQEDVRPSGHDRLQPEAGDRSPHRGLAADRPATGPRSGHTCLTTPFPGPRCRRSSHERIGRFRMMPSSPRSTAVSADRSRSRPAPDARACCLPRPHSPSPHAAGGYCSSHTATNSWKRTPQPLPSANAVCEAKTTSEGPKPSPAAVMIAPTPMSSTK